MSKDAWEDEDEEHAQRADDFVSQMDENGIIGLPEALEDMQLGATCGDTHPERKLPGSSVHLTPEREDPSGRLGDLEAEELNYNLGVGPSGLSKHYRPEPQSASAVTASFWPQLFHFTADELAAAQGIDAETFPEISFSERLPESNCSYSSCESSSHCVGIDLRASPQPAASLSEQVISNQYSRLSNGAVEESDKHLNTTHSPGKAKKRSPEATSLMSCSLSTVEMDTSLSKQQSKAGNDGAKVNGSRKGYLSFHTPDFSRVEPKIHFPKDGYKPPKSKHLLMKKSLSPELPLVFKSPADIVKEVLLCNTDGSSTASDCSRPANRTSNSTVPQEFRCRQQARTLLEQLQEDHHRLLTKYAEAKNTIDRLRLEAKVNLYSDPPKPGHSAHSGLNDNTSKFLKLDFSQVQKAEISSTSLCPNGLCTQQGSSDACPSTGSPDLRLGQQLSNIIFDQTGKFLQQLQAFEDLLKSKKLKSFEKMKGLAQLTEGLNSLERGYLFARDEHKLLQQRAVETSHFDPERELEGQIFQCGVRMEDLKELMEQLQHEEPTCEASSSPTLQPTSSFDSCDGGEMLLHPQSPTVPSLVDPDNEAKVAKRSNKEEVRDEETLGSPHYRPQTTSVVQDFTEPVDRQRGFKEPSQSVPHSATVTPDMQHGDKEEEEQQAQGVIKHVVWKTTSPSNHQHTRSSPPLVSQSTMLPVLLPCSRRLESPSSSLSSIADITASQKLSSKDEMGSKRVLPQDGILSPETDSGFVGSETSHLTCAAAPGRVHQRASESSSVFQEGSSRRSETDPAAESPPASTLSHRRVAQKHKVDPQPSQRPDAMQALQAEVTKLSERLDSFLRSETPPSTVTPAPAQKNCPHHDTSTPRIRSGREKSEVNQGRRETQTGAGEESDFARRERRARSASAQRQKPLYDFLTSPDAEFSTAKPRPTASRCTQTSATSDSFYSTPVLSKGTQTRQHVSETAYVPDSRDEARRRVHEELEEHHGLDVSLNRAISSAQRMKHTARHMARSLATGLHYQERLVQSCSN
ncbi:uncharacterized protein akna [Xenentodon cancila]